MSINSKLSRILRLHRFWQWKVHHFWKRFSCWNQVNFLLDCWKATSNNKETTLVSPLQSPGAPLLEWPRAMLHICKLETAPVLGGLEATATRNSMSNRPKQRQGSCILKQSNMRTKRKQYQTEVPKIAQSCSILYAPPSQLSIAVITHLDPPLKPTAPLHLIFCHATISQSQRWHVRFHSSCEHINRRNLKWRFTAWNHQSHGIASKIPLQLRSVRSCQLHRTKMFNSPPRCTVSPFASPFHSVSASPHLEGVEALVEPRVAPKPSRFVIQKALLTTIWWPPCLLSSWRSLRKGPRTKLWYGWHALHFTDFTMVMPLIRRLLRGGFWRLASNALTPPPKAPKPAWSA